MPIHTITPSQGIFCLRGSTALRSLRYALLLSIGCLLAACSAQPSAALSAQHNLSHPQLPADAKTLLAHAEAVHRASREHELIWQQFWNPQQGFIIYYRQGPALLYTQSEPLPGGLEVAPNTYFYATGLDRLTDGIFLRYPVGDKTVTAVALQSSMEETAGLLFHEAFHVHQAEYFNQRLEARFVDDTLFADAHVRALLEMRRQVLLAALTDIADSRPSTSQARLRPHQLALLTLDNELRESIGDATLERLYQLEIIEGTAALVGLRAHLLSLPNHPRGVDLHASMTTNLSKGLARPEGGIHSASDLRLYAYGTGAASVFLLAQLSSDYQTLIATKLVDAQVLTLLEPSTAPRPLTAVFAAYDYAGWLSWAEADETSSQQLSLPDFATLTPATLDIAIGLHSAAAAQALNVNFSSGTRGFSQPAQGSYMLPQPLSVSVHGRQTSLLIEGPATHLMSPQQDSPVLRLQVKVESLPALCAYNPDGTRVLSCELDAISFEWQGVQFEHQATTSVSQRGQHLHIDVHEH